MGSGLRLFPPPKITNCRINEKIIVRGVDSHHTYSCGCGLENGRDKLLMDDLNRGNNKISRLGERAKFCMAFLIGFGVYI